MSRATFNMSVSATGHIALPIFIFILQFHIGCHSLHISSGSVASIMLNTVLSSVTANILYISMCVRKSGHVVQACVGKAVLSPGTTSPR